MATARSNHPYEYMHENEIDEELKCPICTQPFEQPVSLSCQHTFCRHCIETWLDEHQSCPTCRQTEETFTPINTQIITNQLNRLLVRCNQCEAMNIQRGNFREHEEQCSKRLVRCSAADIECAWRGEREDLDVHLTKCPFQQIRPVIDRLQQQFGGLERIGNELREKVDSQSEQIHFLLALINQGNLMNKDCLKLYSRCQYSMRNTNQARSKITFYCTACERTVQRRSVALHACSLDEQINCICQCCYDKQFFSSFSEEIDEEIEDE